MVASVWTLTAVSSMASMAVRGISLASSWIADRRIFDDGGIRLEPDRQSAAMAMRGTRTAQNLRRWNLDGCYDLESDRQSESSTNAVRGIRTAPMVDSSESSTMAASVWNQTANLRRWRHPCSITVLNMCICLILFMLLLQMKETVRRFPTSRRALSF